MKRYDADSRDVFLAGERTDLAWDRSGLSLLACGLLVLRGMARPPLTKGHLVVGSFIVGLAAVTVLLGWWHARRARRRGPRETTLVDLAPISCCVALVGIGAFVLAALFPS